MHWELLSDFKKSMIVTTVNDIENATNNFTSIIKTSYNWSRENKITTFQSLNKMNPWITSGTLA